MLFFSWLCVPLHRESRFRYVQFISIIVNKGFLIYPPCVVIRVADLYFYETSVAPVTLLFSFQSRSYWYILRFIMMSPAPFWDFWRCNFTPFWVYLQGFRWKTIKIFYLQFGHLALFRLVIWLNDIWSFDFLLLGYLAKCCSVILFQLGVFSDMAFLAIPSGYSNK